MRKTKLIGVHACDGRAQVLTVVTKGEPHFVHRREPCAECPWRKDSPRGAFPPEAYRHSAATCYDMAPNTFACHMSGSVSPATCAGFLLSRPALHNLGVRLALAKGHLDLDQLRSTVPLYRTYRAMAIANGVDRDDPALALCRDD